MKKVTLTKEDEKEICKLYESGIGVTPLCERFKVGKLKIKSILKENGIEMKKAGGQKQKTENVVEDWRIDKYCNIEDGYHYIYEDTNGDFSSPDIKNTSGILTTYIKNRYGVDVPSLFDRRKYYMRTGNYWWEQWLTIKKVKNAETKKCPYCGWETIDVDNKSGAFGQHIKSCHNLSISEHLLKHPDDSEYFSVESRRIKRESLMSLPGHHVTCPICGKKMFKMTISHIESHGLTIADFKSKYSDFVMESQYMHEIDSKQQIEVNKLPRKRGRRSLPEKEICSFLDDNSINYTCNDRIILDGKEIDILIPDFKLGIEFNGLRYHHSEPERHIEKTKLANKKGYKLFQIFEDEFIKRKHLVFNMISEALNLNENKLVVNASDCTVREIQPDTAREFLDANDMDGFAKSNVHVGAYMDDEIVGVVSFRKTYLDLSQEWDMNRCATSYKYKCQGVIDKMFSFFIEKHKPNSIIGFADRRWCLNPLDNFYIELGFKYNGTTRPTYTYFRKDYSVGEYRNRRFHKLDFRKRILMEKDSSLTSDMTEEEMANKLGFYRIWDCGLFKYVWTKNGTSD